MQEGKTKAGKHEVSNDASGNIILRVYHHRWRNESVGDQLMSMFIVQEVPDWFESRNAGIFLKCKSLIFFSCVTYFHINNDASRKWNHSLCYTEKNWGLLSIEVI